MMEVTESTVKNFEDFLIERQEADIVACLAGNNERFCRWGPAVYYESDLASLIEQGDLGIQYLSQEYVADEIL